jgi:hypothetical protein
MASNLELDVEIWAQQQFGSCGLGDRRRTKRAVQLAAQVAARPDASTPDQTERWSDCKAAYRLFDNEDVTFAGLAGPHWELTRRQDEGVYLLLGDTTHIDIGWDRKVQGLAPVGDGHSQGFLLHSSLMVNARTEEIVGLAGQDLYYRRPAPRGETARQRLQRERESQVWGRVIDLVGRPPENVRFIHVFDAGADNLEVFCHLQLQGCDWVVRVAEKNRILTRPEGGRGSVAALLSEQPLLGSYQLQVRARPGQAARWALLEVRSLTAAMPIPPGASPFARQSGLSEIPLGVVEVREPHPPRGVEPLHWVLYTSETCGTFGQACRVIEYYEKRPLVEEFHKALKTGCRLEVRQYRLARRWEALTGLLSVVAVRLLQLKSLARTEPERPAREVVPQRWIQMLERVRRSPRPINSIREFVRSLAGLGGFLGRKHDGEPGWITIWRGLEKLLLCLRGADSKRCG